MKYYCSAVQSLVGHADMDMIEHYLHVQQSVRKTAVARFDHGLVHLDDGRSLPLKGWLHVATYGADSILLADRDRYELCDFTIRWFIHQDGIEL